MLPCTKLDRYLDVCFHSSYGVCYKEKKPENYLAPFQKQGDMKNRSNLSLQTSFGEYVYCNACMTI